MAKGAGAGKVSEAQVESGSVSSFGILRGDKTGPFHDVWEKLLEKRLPLISEASGCTMLPAATLKTETPTKHLRISLSWRTPCELQNFLSCGRS